MMGRLAGRNAIVTGSANGIGRAIAERFAAEGANVLVADIDGTAAQTAVDAITAAGGSAQASGTDVASAVDVEAMFARAADAFGPVDVLVCNAALTATERHFLEADDDWWQQIIAVNLSGVFNCCRVAARLMAARGSGAIINMSSGGGSRAHRGNAAYDAAKGGIEAFTRALALDLGPYGVRVNSLAPGSIDTKGMDPAVKAERGETVPLRRMGEPADLAGPALFLASDDAAYVSGHLLVADGGLLAQQRSPQVDIFPLSRFPNLPGRA
jgi:2-hydroxycyclohexanecarboxyl-CoA dehydrogenase